MRLCLVIISLVAAVIAPVFARSDAGQDSDIAPIMIEITGPLSYEDVDNNGTLEVLVGGVVVVPPFGFDAGYFGAGQEITVTGYLLPDDTIEATSLIVADAVAEATPEATPAVSDIEEADEDEHDREADQREREEERREAEREREEEKREAEREREEAQREREEAQREREEERREAERERDEAQREERGIVEVSGEVTAVTQNYIIVDGVEVSAGGIFQPSQYEVGDRVHVTGVYENNGMLRALSIEDLPDTAEVEATPEPESTSETEDTPTCVPETHPVANALAAEFDMDVTAILAMHCAGHGFGDIARAFLLGEAAGGTPQSYLDLLGTGRDWGQIARGAGFEPGVIAPDRVLGGNHGNGG